MNILSEEQINELEDFILMYKPPVKKENEIKYYQLCNESLELGKRCFIEIKNQEPKTYLKFAASSINTYSLYKSKNYNIYLFVIHFQDIVSYLPIKYESWFDIKA